MLVVSFIASGLLISVVAYLTRRRPPTAPVDVDEAVMERFEKIMAAPEPGATSH